MKNELLELKAHVKRLDAMRMRVFSLGAVHIETVRQVDTYFNSPKGRLKLREDNSNEKAKLIYYLREDKAEAKRSETILIDVQEPEAFKALFENLLGKRGIVDKEREIYMFEGTQIHLDTVKNLGTFIEFERKITNTSNDRLVIEDLMKRLQIEKEDLIHGSYSDLLKL